ncbi:FAD-binding protein [Curtobacterium sp. Leaf261]|uniref:FAD-binding protein n=1 Tax=Curtobacterium sp. Leaf261 TaxID=1736311 RepID=UPI0006FC0C85|nr:FAD-binding protein [Curtobacterium sp. Leaf261]KQO62122.1 hypothetical protein ASF23_09790 [Curtobacterium sp. Leaf261]
MTTTETPGTVGTNWAGNVEYAARELLEPTSVDELRAAVTAHPQVTALGSRHSFNRIADTDAVQVSLARMPGTVDVDGERSVARVAAGLTHARVAAALDAAGYALPNLASLPHISVAGAVQTGTHGSGVRNPSLASSVVGLEIVRADGTLDVVGDTAGGHAERDGSAGPSDELDAHRVGIGALGIVTAVHLAVEPSFEVAQTIHTGLSWDAVDAGFEDIMSAGYSVSMFTGFTDDGIRQVWTKRRTDRDDPVVDLEALGARPSTSPLHPVPGSEAAGVTEQGGVPGPWFERLPHFRSSFTPSNGAEIQCEYLLPVADAVPAIHALRAIADRLAPVLFVSEIRRIAADTAWLAPSSGRDSVAFHFTFRRDTEGVAAVLPLIDEALAPFDARPHWGKVTSMTSGRLHEVYPKLADFTAVADRVDPGGRFRNAFLRDLLG